MSVLDRAAMDPVQEVDDQVIVKLVRLAAMAILGIGGVIAVLLLTENPIKWIQFWLHVAVALTALVGLVLSLRGHDRWAASVIIWGSWVIVSAVTASNGGVRGPNLLNYPVLIVFSGWILGTRPTQWLVALTGLVFMGLVWADGRGWFPPADYGNKMAYAAYLAGILVLTSGLTLMSRNSYLRKIALARTVAADLRARENELHKLYLAVEQSPDSILITDLASRIEYVNQAFLRNSGYTQQQIVGRKAGVLGSTQTPQATYDAMWAALADGKSWSGEYQSLRQDGSEFTASATMAPLRQADGTITHYVAVSRDITAQREAEARIHQLSFYDSLTGLPNRTLLLQWLAQALTRSQQVGQQSALLLLNVDRFKTLNDARGSAVGDALLVKLGSRLQVLLRPGDVLARVAADEFALLLHDLSTDSAAASHQALEMAHQIQSSLDRPFGLPQGEEVAVTASVGITLFPLAAQEEADEVLRRAHNALHRAKLEGGHRNAFFDARMGESAQQRFLIERELQQAIGGGQLQLYLQPQFDGARQVVGAEVLVRWNHPQRGLIGPGAFIPVAEESELIVRLGSWVLEQSCMLMAHETVSGHPLRLSVNLSSRQFRDAGFVDWVKDLLRRTGADPTQLTLEVTESLLINNMDEVIAAMGQLSALGIHFSIDDFGTGYSSLAYLKRLPIDEIKIDKSFVQDAPVDTDDAALVETILSVARHMHLKVVAEGVETQAQADFLARQSREVIYQGYLFGKPEPAEVWLGRWRSLP